MSEEWRPGARYLLGLIVVGGAFALVGIRGASSEGYRAWVKDPATVRGFFESHPVRKLQLGAGGNDPAGWLNSDIEPQKDEIFLDATQPFPFPDQSIHYVFSEHVIEHLPWEGGLHMLKETYRVLAPGGKIRVVTPNLEKFIQLLAGGNDSGEEAYVATKLRFHGWPETPVPRAYIFNRQVRDWGHQFLYDPATLRRSLELAGFHEITERRVEEATDPVFDEVEARTKREGSDIWSVNRWEAMTFDATR